MPRSQPARSNAPRAHHARRPVAMLGALPALAALALPAQAVAEVTLFTFFKTIAYLQNSPDVADESFAYSSSSIFFEDAAEAALVELTGPGGTTTYTDFGTQHYFSTAFSDRPSMDAAYPSEAVYTMTVSGGQLGTVAETFAVPADAYPDNAPVVGNFFDLQSLDSTSDFTLYLNGFQGLTFIDIYAVGSGTPVYSDFSFTPLTEVTIPAGTLAAEVEYRLTIFYSSRLDIVGTTFANANGIIGFDYLTDVYFTTLSGFSFVEGDADSDDDVDFDDLGILLGNYDVGGFAAYTQGDSDGDGFVGFDDLGLLLGNYGFGVDPGELDIGALALPAGLSQATIAIPEPAGLLCLAALPTALLTRRRRR